MTIIHGENIIASREKLITLLDKIKESGGEIVKLEAKELSEAVLEELFGANDLFGTQKTIVIEGLHSLPKSKKQKTLIELSTNSQIHEVILWEKRTLTKTMLKPFSNTQVFEFKASKTLFNWLDMLGTKENETKKLQLLQDAIATDGEYFCFIMLIRQFRLLIQAKTDSQIAGAPFMITKLKKQAERFTLNQLVGIYSKLLEFDLSQKTSKNLLSVNQWLDLLSLKL